MAVSIPMALKSWLCGFIAVTFLTACGGGSSSDLPGDVGNRTYASDASLAITPLAAPPPTRISSTWGRIALFQVFDERAHHGMTTNQILQDAPRYDAVWGAGRPSVWNSAHPSMLVSLYFIQEQDWRQAGGHNLTWWQANHPDWILYACDGTGTPTHRIAYMHGETDVPLDIHNPAVADYQIRQTFGPYASAHGYNALAIDEVFFFDDMGWDLGPGYYGCGIWSNGGFIRRYSGRYDPQWASDTLAWIKSAKSIVTTDPVIGPQHLALIVNHPPSAVSNPNEEQLLANVDALLDESGFSMYGNFASDTHHFKATLDYMIYAQRHGVAMLMVDKFVQDSVTVTPLHLEYSIATYLMGNEQGAALFTTPNNGPGVGYGMEQYHPEYKSNLGTPCAQYYGGPGYDANNPDIYYRRFNGGLAVVNSGSKSKTSELATLPAGHTYTDIENRTVSNPLAVNSNDAYVLLTSNGCN
ncbi:MAG: hypothetical protein GIX02_09665 [Candidatus Eremiobacteraeota bacterium]|nr:hypothetical protein [Candidatus Eremiobacteraeota bacterium]